MADIIRIARDGVIEESRLDGLKFLDLQKHLVGQQWQVRYYRDEDKSLVDTIVAIGVKNGTGSECYRVISYGTRDAITAITDTLPDISELIHGEVYIINIDGVWNYVTASDDIRHIDPITGGPYAYFNLEDGYVWYFREGALYREDDFYTHGDETIDGTWSFNKIIAEEAEIGNIDDLISDHLGSLGVGNLLKNTALTGQYESKEMENETNLQDDTDVYSDVKEDWNITTREVKIVPDTAAISGFAFYLPNELTEVSQDSVIDLINDNEYVLSWKQKGTIQVEISDYEFEIKRVNRSKDLGGYIHYFARFTQTGNRKVTIKFRGGSGYLCDIKLEEGIIPTTWSPSPLDTDPVATKINNYDFLRTAFLEYTKDESVSSLFLKNQIKVGEYVDGEVEKVSGGLSGVYNDDQDILFWSGSDYKAAQKLAQNLIKNPELLKDLNYSDQAKAIITHGSKSIFTDSLAKGRFYGYFIDNKGRSVLGKMGLNADLPFTTLNDNNMLVRKYIGFVDGLAMSLNDRNIPLTDDNFSTEGYNGGSIIKFKDGLAYDLNSDTLYNSFMTLYNSLNSSENTIDHILYFVNGYLKSITTEPYTYWY